MKAFFSIFVFALPIIAILTSCQKSLSLVIPPPQQTPVTLDSMLRCHGQINWDSAAIKNALTGKWKWEFIKCYDNPAHTNADDYKTMAIEFKPNDSLEVKQNGIKIQTSSWHITSTNDGYFKLVVNPIVYQLPGKILICGERVLFYDGYVDGCDNYFKKQD